MLLTILKVLLFFAVILAIALGFSHLSETGQGLQVVFNGVEYTLGPVSALIVALVLVIVAWLALKVLGLLWALLRFVTGDETAINRYFSRNRERKGHQALSDGILALAAGDARTARAKAEKAGGLLKQPAAARVLEAQAAHAAGDQDRAEAVYRHLLNDNRTRFVGVRGLMHQQLEKGDHDKALELARKAYELRPNSDVQDTLLLLQTEKGDWKGARHVLKDKRRQGDLPQDVHIRRDALLALKEAQDVLAHENSVSAREAAISANKASPDLIPAAALAARSYIARGEPKNAARVLEKTWSVRPHPEIAEAYAEIAPNESAAQRRRRFDVLIRKNPDDPESHLLQSELALADEDFPAARRALGNLAETQPTVRSLSLMAAIERGMGADDSVVRGWLARAMTASRGPQWVCDKCGHVMADWGPVCDHCHGFDTLTWKVPDEQVQKTSTAGVELLPLLIGAPSGPVVSAPAPPPQPEPEIVEEVEIADVTPGMVPRESDFVKVKTTAKPESEAKHAPQPEVRVEAAKEQSALKTAPQPAAEPVVAAEPVTPEPAAAPVAAAKKPAPAIDLPLMAEPVPQMPEQVVEAPKPTAVPERPTRKLIPGAEPIRVEPLPVARAGAESDAARAGVVAAKEPKAKDPDSFDSDGLNTDELAPEASPAPHGDDSVVPMPAADPEKPAEKSGFLGFGKKR